MKKFITTVFSLIISLVLTGCITVNTSASNGSGNGEQTPPEAPVYATQYSFDQTHHWYAQLNGDGKKDYAEHENEKGKCYYCDFYFETDDVIYELKYNYNSSTNGYDFYYVAKDYVSGIYSDVHIEIPVMHYQALPTNDAIINDYAEDKPYPVLELGKEAFRVNSGESSIETIKLNEGLKKIGESAFRDCLIKELVIPNSVEGTLSMICVNCTLLERAVVGNGVTKLSAYSFSSCGRLKTVVIGEKVTEIGQRAFYDCDNIDYLVFPKSLISIPESQTMDKNLGNRYASLFNIFQGAPVGVPNAIYFEITKAEYEALVLPQLPRDEETGLTLDEDGNIIPADQFKTTTKGFVLGWNNGAKLYFKGEWEYDNNQKPKPVI